MTRRRLLLVSLTLVLVSIGLYAANTLTVPEWAFRLTIGTRPDIRTSSPSARTYPAISWARGYDPSDFASSSDLIPFLRDLQVPIPPLLAVAEVLSQLHIGSVAPITVGLYQFSLIGAFVLALVLCRRNLWSLSVCFVLSVAFLTSAIQVHRLNPQTYDVLLPFLLLLFITALDLFPSVRRPSAQRWLAALSGLSLSLAELTRPFMVYIVPLLVISAIGVLRGSRSLLCFFVPLILLSGSWHAHLAIRHHRLAWTNHAGFNLQRAWPMVEAPELIDESNAAPLGPGRRPNINTDEHAENSRRLSRAVFRWAAAHPVTAVSHVLQRIYELLYEIPPIYGVLGTSEANYPIYRLLVRVCAGGWLLSLAAFVSAIVRGRASPFSPAVWSSSSGALVIATSGLIFFLAVGDHGEEFRFLVTILPLFAALPFAVLGNGRTAPTQR